MDKDYKQLKILIMRILPETCNYAKNTSISQLLPDMQHQSNTANRQDQ